MSASRFYHLFFLAHEHNPETIGISLYHNISISLTIYLLFMLIISSLGLLIHFCIFSLLAPFFIKDSMNLRAILCLLPFITLVSPLLWVIRNFIINFEVLVAACTKFVPFVVENGKVRVELKRKGNNNICYLLVIQECN